MKDEFEVGRVVCPYCGYKLPLFYNKDTNCFGLVVKCKGRNCHKMIDVRIKNGKQY